jgi:hypothetical protein
MGLALLLVFYARGKGWVVILNLEADKGKGLTPRDINQSQHTTTGMQCPGLLHDNK